MEAILTAVIIFAATNIDDLFILLLFFSQINHSFLRRHIIIGQYLGFIALVLISLIGFLVSFIIPSVWIGFLGLVPIFIGVYKLFNPEQRGVATKNKKNIKQPATPPSLFSSLLNPKTYTVASITFANGGDNIGVYTPLFANSDLPRLAIIIAIFLVLVAVWCFVGYRLTRRPKIGQAFSRWGHIFVPFVLISLGIYIIIENRTFALFFP